MIIEMKTVISLQKELPGYKLKELKRALKAAKGDLERAKENLLKQQQKETKKSKKAEKPEKTEPAKETEKGD